MLNQLNQVSLLFKISSICVENCSGVQGCKKPKKNNILSSSFVLPCKQLDSKSCPASFQMWVYQNFRGARYDLSEACTIGWPSWSRIVLLIKQLRSHTRLLNNRALEARQQVTVFRFLVTAVLKLDPPQACWEPRKNDYEDLKWEWETVTLRQLSDGSSQTFVALL